MVCVLSYAFEIKWCVSNTSLFPLVYFHASCPDCCPSSTRKPPLMRNLEAAVHERYADVPKKYSTRPPASFQDLDPSIHLIHLKQAWIVLLARARFTKRDVLNELQGSDSDSLPSNSPNFACRVVPVPDAMRCTVSLAISSANHGPPICLVAAVKCGRMWITYLPRKRVALLALYLCTVLGVPRLAVASYSRSNGKLHSLPIANLLVICQQLE